MLLQWCKEITTLFPLQPCIYMAELTNHQPSLYFAIERINNEIAFVPHKVTSDFSPLSSFSASDLHLAAYLNDSHSTQVGIRVKDLCTVELVHVGTSELEFIAHSRRKLWPPFNPYNTKRPKRMEKDIMVDLCKNIFMPLCREVLLESGYRFRGNQCTCWGGSCQWRRRECQEWRNKYCNRGKGVV